MTAAQLKAWRKSIPGRARNVPPASQADAAYLLGVSLRAYQNYEAGAAAVPPHVPMMVRLYDAADPGRTSWVYYLADSATEAADGSRPPTDWQIGAGKRPAYRGGKR